MALFGKRIKRRLVTDPVIWADSEPNEGDAYTVPDPPPGRMPEPEPEPDEDEETPEPVHDPGEYDDPSTDPEPQSLSARRQAQRRKAAVRTYTRAEVQSFRTQAYDQGYKACMGVAELCKIAYEDLDESPMFGMMKEGLDADEARARIQASRAKASEQTAIRTMQLPDDGIEKEKSPQRQISGDMVKAAYANYNSSLLKFK
jgi:hypothetical protein